MNALWLLPALFFYTLAMGGFILDRIGSKTRLAQAATWMLALGAATQAAYLAAAAIQVGNVPVVNFGQSLCFLAWLIALAALVLIVRYRMSVIGAIVTPIIFLANAVAVSTSHVGRIVIPETLRSAWLPIHVTLAFLGYALFVLAAGVSVVYLVSERRLKAKRPFDTSDDRSPSLEKLDRINYHLLGWGFLMLSLAITSGAIWADASWGHFWSWEPQETWSLAIWVLYAALLESRLTVGWRGRRVAALTIVVFTVLVGSFISVSLITPGKHGGSFG